MLRMQFSDLDPDQDSLAMLLDSTTGGRVMTSRPEADPLLAPKFRTLSVVILRRCNHEVEYLEFNKSDNANYAIKLLLKQVDVISAARGSDYEVPA